MVLRLLSYEDLSQILGISVTTIRTYMGNYTFSDFREKIKFKNYVREVCVFNKKFAYALSEFLLRRNKYKAVRNLEKYYDKWEKENGNREL